MPRSLFAPRAAVTLNSGVRWGVAIAGPWTPERREKMRATLNSMSREALRFAGSSASRGG